MKNILIHWRGLTPSKETKEKTESILKTLKYILPQDSDIRISLEKFSKHYEGHIVIRSPLGDFAAQNSNKNLYGLCKNLCKNLKLQIFKHRQTHTSWAKAS